MVVCSIITIIVGLVFVGLRTCRDAHVEILSIIIGICFIAYSVRRLIEM